MLRFTNVAYEIDHFGGKSRLLIDLEFRFSCKMINFNQKIFHWDTDKIK
jgi:hypothetical protein